MYHPYYDRDPYGRRGLCICPPHPIPLAPSYTRGTYPDIQQDQERIYVKGMDGTITPFPSYTKYVSGYFSRTLNFSKDKGTEDDPIVIEEPSFLLQIISMMIRALSDAARDVYGKPVAITHMVYPEVTFSGEGEEDVSKSIILVNPLVKKEIQPYIPLVGNTINNKALKDLTDIADYLEIPSLTNALSSYIANQVFYYMKPLMTPDATPRDLLPNLKTVLLENNLDGPSYPLSDPILISILKHLKLKKLDVAEKSVADYIGEHGQPPVDEDIAVDLTNERITSLIGLDLILSRKEITSLYLISNNILGSNFDQGILEKSLFEEWGSLSELDLSINNIQLLPENIFKELTALKTLDLSNNQLQALPENIFKGLTALEILLLSSNQLQSLPENIFKGLTALRLLWVSDNKLQSLPENIFQGLTVLESLLLSSNHLQSLPENIFKGLTALESLLLSSNHLQSLPENIFHGLTVLEELELSYNQLQALPKNAFQGLTALKRLWLNDNYLQSLPENVFQGLTALTTLYVGYNFLPGNDEQFITRYNLQHVGTVDFYPQNKPHQPITQWHRNHSYSNVQNTPPPMMPYCW